MLSQVHMPTHVQKRLDVRSIAHANQTFDCTFLLDNCPCLIKTCASSHVTIKQAANVDYYLEVTFIRILILTVIDST